MVTLDRIYHAERILSGTIRDTDLIYSYSLSEQCGCDLYLKPETLQVTGSFKVRGAYYKISQLGDEERSRGVIACSAGNHAQGVALASMKFGIRSIVCMPAGAPISKVEATKGYGAEVISVPGVYDDAYDEAVRLREKHGYTFIHPFDDEDIITGQGTVGAEIMRDLPDVDAIIVPVGGGGLISGVAFAAKSVNPGVKVYGVQAAGAASMAESLDKGVISRLDSVSTIADGIAVKEPGSITFDMCREYVDKVVTVSEDQISAAILALMERHKMIAEGAGSVALAAAIFGAIPEIKGKKVVCIVSGGNIDVNILSRVINRGLLITGRCCTFTVKLEDHPGHLVQVLDIISKCGANIMQVQHERNSQGTEVNSCYLKIQMETRNAEHIRQIKERLENSGFMIINE